MFGTDVVHNAVHGSSSKEQAQHKIETVFGSLEFNPDGTVRGIHWSCWPWGICLVTTVWLQPAYHAHLVACPPMYTLAQLMQWNPCYKYTSVCSLGLINMELFLESYWWAVSNAPKVKQEFILLQKEWQSVKNENKMKIIVKLFCSSPPPWHLPVLIDLRFFLIVVVKRQLKNVFLMLGDGGWTWPCFCFRLPSKNQQSAWGCLSSHLANPDHVFLKFGDMGWTWPCFYFWLPFKI